MGLKGNPMDARNYNLCKPDLLDAADRHNIYITHDISVISQNKGRGQLYNNPQHEQNKISQLPSCLMTSMYLQRVQPVQKVPFLILTLSTPHATLVMISHLVEKVPSLELLHATKFSMRLV